VSSRTQFSTRLHCVLFLRAEKMALPVTHVLWKNYVEEGRVTADDFLVTYDAAGVNPGELKEGQILMELLYLSVDPYMRGRMRNTKVHTVQR